MARRSYKKYNQNSIEINKGNNKFNNKYKID